MNANRHDARERAFHLLYESEMKGESGGEVLAALPVEPDDFASELVAGFDAHRDEVDAVIGAHSHNWEVDRMPALDRAVLRLATFELMHRADVPTGVVISEAVGLATSYSTEESGRFVNGVLSAIAAQVRPDSL